MLWRDHLFVICVDRLQFDEPILYVALLIGVAYQLDDDNTFILASIKRYHNWIAQSI